MTFGVVPTRFGRLVSRDDRDKQFPLRAVLRRRVARPSSRYWAGGTITDQKETPHCVGHAWHGFLCASPVRTREPKPLEIYNGAQELDEWPGVGYAGTSVRGGARYLSEVLPKVIEYRWAFALDDVLDWLATKGPVVFGTEWFAGMMKPNPIGLLDVSGLSEGGHAYLVLGYSTPRRAFRIQNSWGKKWGQKGRAWLNWDVWEQKLAQDGEACVAVEKAV